VSAPTGTRDVGGPIPDGWRARLRAAHPVEVLRRLRVCLLAVLALNALLYLLMAGEAGHQIAAARRTAQAVREIDEARDAAIGARADVWKTFHQEDATLTFTGIPFENHMTEVNSDLATAAEGNAAGPEGTRHIRFVLGEETTCGWLAHVAVIDYGRLRSPAVADPVLDALGAPDQKDPDPPHASVPDTGGLIAALADLRSLEADALAGQRRSWWLAPGFHWPLLLSPVLAVLLLTISTGRVVARHFRRFVSPWLLAASATTAAVDVTVGVLLGHDERLPAVPWAGHPLTITVVLLLLAAAAVFGYLAYRPRLAEYRFRLS
jgi:hypothetical protein